MGGFLSRPARPGYTTHAFRITMRILPLLMLSLLPALTPRAAEIGAIAHPGDAFPKDRTVVWTPLFQAAWDELNRGLGIPVKTEPPNPLMDRLDHFEWKVDSVMPAGGWHVWAGESTREVIDHANAEAARMTGQKAGPFRIAPRDGGRIALGLLERNLVFRKSLQRSTASPLVFHGADGTESKVGFFGVRGKASGSYGGVVRVLAYQEGSHAVQIAGEGDESAVLYLPGRHASFAEACATLREWRAAKPTGEFGSARDPALHDKDDLRIPFLKTSRSVDFLPLLASLRFFEDGGLPWRLYHAEQRVKFDLSEKGAKLRAEVETGMDPFGEPPPPPPMVPRDFHYDRPFFVFLWRAGADCPYFGAWIGDSSAMEEFKAP